MKQASLKDKIARMRYSYPMVYRSRVAKATKKQPPASELSRSINRSKTPGASRQEVFNTTELLEKIISFLPPFEILTKAQRVSSGWKNTIAASPTVQTVLWNPPFAHVLSPSAHSHEIEGTRNDQRAEEDLDNFIPIKTSVDDLATGVPKYSEAVAFQGLFFTGSDGDRYDFALSIEKIPIGYMHSAEMDWVDHPVITTPPGTRSTWVDKYITSPPITVA
jgi:hypothetical protein